MDEFVQWRTSSRTQGQGQCVEVGFGPAGVGVRDTKDRTGGQLTIRNGQWTAFVNDLKLGSLPAE